MNSTEITANTILSTTGGNFDGLIYYNGGTASVINVFDNTVADVVFPCDFNNDPTITTADTSVLAVGMFVTGTGIPEGSTIASITDGTTFELSVSTTGGNRGGGSGLLTFIDTTNQIAKFNVAADTSDVIRGLDIICRNGIKIIADNFTTLEIFALTN
tara:strand:- start:13 stop:486 length:474 start_codon:yes stop_codon:yes gene_type:complete